MQRKDEDLGVLPDTSLDPSQRFTLWLQNHRPFVCQMLLPGGSVEVNKVPCPLTYPPGSISRLLRGDRHLQLVVTAEHQKACPPPSAPHTEESPPAKPPPPLFLHLCSAPGRGKQPPSWHPCLPPIHFPAASCGIYKCKSDQLTSHVKRVKVYSSVCQVGVHPLLLARPLLVDFSRPLCLPLLLSSCVAHRGTLCSAFSPHASLTTPLSQEALREPPPPAARL